jgi:hypothetical protein
MSLHYTCYLSRITAWSYRLIKPKHVAVDSERDVSCAVTDKLPFCWVTTHWDVFYSVKNYLFALYLYPPPSPGAFPSIDERLRFVLSIHVQRLNNMSHVTHRLTFSSFNSSKIILRAPLGVAKVTLQKPYTHFTWV